MASEKWSSFPAPHEVTKGGAYRRPNVRAEISDRLQVGVSRPIRSGLFNDKLRGIQFSSDIRHSPP
jgi:hypothetical protein